MYQNLFAVDRAQYVGKHERPKVPCIFCAIRDKNPDVWTRLLYQDEKVLIVMNIFPYSPGHVQIVPSSHVKDMSELMDDDLEYLLKFLPRCIRLCSLLDPDGFNIGVNLGFEAGASIEHTHLQIVPRYNHTPKLLKQGQIHEFYNEHLEILNEDLEVKEDPKACDCLQEQRYKLKSADGILYYLSQTPYNRGHIIVAPELHYECIEEMSPASSLKLFKAAILAKGIINSCYKPVGINFGINQGDVRGVREDKHLELHVVPRYVPESGFMETIADTRVVVESLDSTYAKLKEIIK